MDLALADALMRTFLDNNMSVRPLATLISRTVTLRENATGTW